MRRPKLALSAAVAAIALSATAGILAQQPSRDDSGGTGSKSSYTFSPQHARRPKGGEPAKPYNPMASSRGARQLMRNGEDFFELGQYERALDFFREAEDRQFELTADERKTLQQSIQKSRQAMRATDERVASAPSQGRRASATRRAGAVALAVPGATEKPLRSDSIQLTSATQTQPAPAPAPAALEASPTAKPKGEDVAPELLPQAALAMADEPAPAKPVAPQASGPMELPPLPSEPTAPAAAPEPLRSEAPAVEPAGAAVAEESTRPPDPGPITRTVADEAAPPATAEESAPPALAETAVEPAAAATEPAAAPEAEPTAPAAAAEPVQDPAPPVADAAPAAESPALVDPPAAAPAAASQPLEQPEPAPAATRPTAPPMEALPGAAPAAAEPAPVARPVVRTAEVDRPETRRDAAPAPAPGAGEMVLPPLPESVLTPAERSPLGILPSIQPTPLPDHLKRQVEQMARLQQDDARRNPPPDLGAPGTPGGPSADDLSGARLELPRAPSPTEIRPIRAIPIPEEFVPLTPRDWSPSRKVWTAAATCHGPLYFQDAVLERYGQSVEHAMGPVGRFFSYPLDDPKQSNQRNQILQPFLSIGLFASQIALWPYNLIVDPPGEAEYDLGYYRPGDRVPNGTVYLPTTGIGPPLRGKDY